MTDVNKANRIICRNCGREDVPDWKDGLCITCARNKVLGNYPEKMEGPNKVDNKEPDETNAKSGATSTVYHGADEALIKSYRYFNQLSVWNLEGRIPVALEADKAKLQSDLLAIVEEADPNKSEPKPNSIYWGHILREKIKQYFGEEK